MARLLSAPTVVSAKRRGFRDSAPNAGIHEDPPQLIWNGQRQVIAAARSHPRRRYAIGHELAHPLTYSLSRYILQLGHIVRIARSSSAPGFANQRQERKAKQPAEAQLILAAIVAKVLGKACRTRQAATLQIEVRPQPTAPTLSRIVPCTWHSVLQAYNDRQSLVPTLAS